MEAIAKYPRPTCLRELRVLMGCCNQLTHYEPGLAAEQVLFRMFMKKGEPFIVKKEMNKEFGATKVAISNNIILNVFDMSKPSLVVTDALGDEFGEILIQNKEGKLDDLAGRWVVIQVGSAALKPAWKN